MVCLWSLGRSHPMKILKTLVFRKTQTHLKKKKASVTRFVNTARVSDGSSHVI